MSRYIEDNGGIQIDNDYFDDYLELLAFLKKTNYGSELFIFIADSRDSFPMVDNVYVVYGFNLLK